MTDYKQLCADLAALAKREHYYCEDSWYSCPKATDGCADDFQGSDCNCGADAHNAKVDALVAALAEPEPEGPTDEKLLEEWRQLMGAPRAVLAQPMLDFARAVLARWGNHPGSPDSSTPQPVPVSERWPEFSDCDSAERVWCWSWAIGTWRLSRINQSIHSHWLPAHALPVPSHD